MVGLMIYFTSMYNVTQFWKIICIGTREIIRTLWLLIRGSAKSRNGTNWGARQVEESFETDFASFPTAT